LTTRSSLARRFLFGADLALSALFKGVRGLYLPKILELPGKKCIGDILIVGCRVVPDAMYDASV
jgi:hypothetical protein